MYGGLFSCFSNRGRAVRWLGSQLGTLRGLTENARIFHTHARIYLPSPILFLSVTWGRKMKSVWLCNLLSTSGTKTCMEVPWTLQHQMDIRCSSSCFFHWDSAWEGWCWSQGYRCKCSGSLGEERDPACWAGCKHSFTEAKLDAELEGGVTGKNWRRKWGGAFHTDVGHTG